MACCPFGVHKFDNRGPVFHSILLINNFVTNSDRNWKWLSSRRLGICFSVSDELLTLCCSSLLRKKTLGMHTKFVTNLWFYFAGHVPWIGYRVSLPRSRTAMQSRLKLQHLFLVTKICQVLQVLLYRTVTCHLLKNFTRSPVDLRNNGRKCARALALPTRHHASSLRIAVAEPVLRSIKMSLPLVLINAKMEEAVTGFVCKISYELLCKFW